MYKPYLHYLNRLTWHINKWA